VRARWVRPVAIALGLAGLLAANYYLRATLEESPRYLYSFLERFYPDQVPILFEQLPTWRLFLPLQEITGAWVTTTLILTYKLERVLTPAGVWYLYNALAIVTAFATTWVLFRSAVFSFTFAICVGFGTQFYHAYAVTGGIASYIVTVYHILLMFTATQIIRGVPWRAGWMAAFAASILLNALGYEGWLDVVALAAVSAPFLYVGLSRLERRAEAARLVAVTAVLMAAGVAYVIIKVSIGFGQVQGSESDVVFNYDSLAMVADDLISNVFTHVYLSVSNFLPPSLVGASAFYQLGPERLIEAQHGYHQPFLYLVPMSQVFFWRYYAGAAFVLLCLALVHTVRRTWRQPSAWTLVLMVGLLMMLVPGATHMLIKFRPMNTMPVMTYHVTVGVLGAGMVISWLVTTAWRNWRNRQAALGVVLAVWAMVFYGALARPPYLAHMAAQSGLGNLLYPNPMKKLVESLGGTYTAPAGLLSYQLMPSRRDDEISSARVLLGDLPDPLPPLDQWRKTSDQITVVAGPDGLSVTGDATQYGYQLMTPPIAVSPGSTYLMRVKLDVQEGRVCAGVLSGDQQRWVVPPDGGTVELQFNSATLDAVRLVVANCYLAESNPVTKFRVAGGSYARLAAREARP
jgi:hypothetical protein